MHDNNANPTQRLVDFVAHAPADETLISMDCNDCCEQIAQLAEQVANGASLDDILPEMQKFMQYWPHCREEFEALVAVLQADNAKTPLGPPVGPGEDEPLRIGLLTGEKNLAPAPRID